VSEQQSAQGRAKSAEYRARELQRASFRAAIKDPVARQALIGDPAFRELVASEVAAERRRQDAAGQQARQEQARRRAAEFAPVRPQASTWDNPWRGDPAHDPRVMRALLDGAPAAEVQRLVAVASAEQARQRGQHQEREAVMWETRNGTLMADAHKQLPGTGLGLPPQAGQQRSVPLPGPEKVRADREAS
jgi:hypothetical protein